MSYINNLITDYYNRINRDRDDSARDHDSTLARQSIMVALNEVANMTEIGNEFSKDHTTVLYAKKKHSKNMRNLDYIELYETAQTTINVVVGKIDTEIFSNKNKAKEFIFALVRENNYLRSELSK
jgi:chromosomal replication initiation ATPase DnaA